MTGMEPLVVAQIAGAAVSAVSAIQQGAAAKSAAEYNAAVANNNAIAARQQAEADAQRQEREARLRMGANIAAMGGSGVTTAGSPLDFLEDNAAQEKLDELRIIHAGEVSATGFENTARLEQARGANAMRGALVSAAGQLAVAGGTAYASGMFASAPNPGGMSKSEAAARGVFSGGTAPTFGS